MRISDLIASCFRSLLRRKVRTLLTIIGRATDESARRGCLHDAEVLLMEDCPLTPLFFTGMDYTLRDGYTGVCRAARGFFSFATVAKLQ